MVAAAAEARAWTAAELTALDRAPLIGVAVRRADGSSRPPVTIGHVRLGDDVLVRSLNGPAGAWYRAAVREERGELEIDGLRIEVAFHPDHGREAQVDAALRSRYGDDAGVRRMTGALAREATLRVIPLG